MYNDSTICLQQAVDGPHPQSRPRKVAQSVLTCVLMVYGWGVTGSFLHFSWQYAKQNGFLSWLFLGGIVPACKSAVWPYFAASALLEKGWTQEEKENLAHYSRSAIASSKAGILLEGFAKQQTLTPTDAARAVELLREALRESKLVRDDVLVKVHRDLPTIYREKYVGCLTGMIRLMEDRRGDAQDIAISQKLGDEWDEWVHAHRKEMQFPKGVPD